MTRTPPPLSVLVSCVACAAFFASGCAKKPPDDGNDDEAADLAPQAQDLAAAPDLLPPPDLAPLGCPRTPAPADRARQVVISLPYDSMGKKADAYAVMPLSADGRLGAPAARFTMGRAVRGPIAFTPDGAVGLVAQEDGTIGVFVLGGETPKVVHAGYKDAGYATSVVMDPSGERAYVLSAQWREAGGGVATVRIGCDGALTMEGMRAEAKLPYALALLPGAPGRAVAFAQDLLDSKDGESAHLLALPPVRRLAGTDAFGDTDAIVASAAATPDGRHVLFGDNNEFSGRPNRVAVLAVERDGLRRAQVLSPVEDPVGIALSPFGNAGLIVSGYGDAVFPFTYDPGSPMAPITLRPEPTYTGKRPQLPDTALVLDRGPLKGRVLLSENTGVRQMAFQADGTLRDLGLTETGSGLSAIPGAIGVQP